MKGKLKNKINAFYEPARLQLGCASLLLGGYMALTIAANVVAMPLVAGFNGIERLAGGKKHVHEVKMIEKGTFVGHNIYAHYGTFLTSQGDTLTLYDSADIPSGKLFGSSRVLRAEVGGRYKVTSLEGPISNKLIKLEDLK